MDVAVTGELRGNLRLELLRYRPHIDGLRAIAIISVVGCHIGLPGFSGGYVGVDIFFVISGFLIITQIVVGMSEGSFRFGDFWSRRALRILPPLIVVLIASVAIGSFVAVTISQFINLGQEAFSSALMAVNFFLVGSGGYFDDVAATQPLLHLWSLAVEEQFYLLAPLVLTAGVWLFRQRRGLVLGLSIAAFFGSFAACVYFSRIEPPIAFFSMPTRGWEFIVGGAIGLVLPSVRDQVRLSSGILGGAGILLIAACVIFLNADPHYPSYIALAPVIGSALLIVEGLAFPSAPLARLLSWKPFVGVGLVSYSWYLWHWPLLAFAREYQFGRLSIPEGILLGAVSLSLAVITYALVERPIRNWRRRSRSSLGWRPALMGFGGSVLAGLALLGITSLLASSGKNLDFELFYPNTGACRLDTMKTAVDCRAAIGSARLGLLLGDSHVAAAYGTYEAIAESRGSKLATLSVPGCPGFLFATSFGTHGQPMDGCVEGHANVVRLLSDGIAADYAILESHWEQYLGGGTLLNGAPRLGIGDAGELTPAKNQERAFVEGMRATLDVLTREGVARILVVESAPDLLQIDCIPRAEKQNTDPDVACSPPRAMVEQDRAMAIRALKQAVSGYPNVRLVDPIDAFCDADRCLARWHKLPLYYDADHLRPSGEILLTNYLRNDFDWVMGVQP